MAVSLGGGNTKGASPEINITPLVDVVLVLLIIFMVVTPALNEGAQIELPNITTPDPKAKYMNPIEVTVAPDGTTVDGIGSSLSQLASRSGLSTSAFQTEILRAFQTWSEVANLNFAVVPNS